MLAAIKRELERLGAEPTIDVDLSGDGSVALLFDGPLQIDTPLLFETQRLLELLRSAAPPLSIDTLIEWASDSRSALPPWTASLWRLDGADTLASAACVLLRFSKGGPVALETLIASALDPEIDQAESVARKRRGETSELARSPWRHLAVERTADGALRHGPLVLRWSGDPPAWSSIARASRAVRLIEEPYSEPLDGDDAIEIVHRSLTPMPGEAPEVDRGDSGPPDVLRVRGLDPALVLDRDRFERTRHAVIGSTLAIDVPLLNTGGEGIGLTVELGGEVIEAGWLRIAGVALFLPEAKGPISAEPSSVREGGARLVRARFERARFGAGLTMPPPFLCKGEERERALRAWNRLEIRVRIEALATAAGRGELQVWARPIRDPIEGAAHVRLDVEGG